MSESVSSKDRILAVCAVAGDWESRTISETTVTDLERFQPTRTIKTLHWEGTEERTRTRTRSPGCSRCNGTGTVYHYGDERRCPGCTEEHTTTTETTTTGKESWVETDYDLDGYPITVRELIEDADAEVLSETQEPDQPAPANIALTDREVTDRVTRTEGVPCTHIEFVAGDHSFDGYRIGGTYRLEQQPELSEETGLISGLFSGGSSIETSETPLEVVGYEATGYVSCECDDESVGVIDDRGTIHGVCSACGRRVTDAGWIDPDRSEDSDVHTEVRATLEQFQEV